MRNRNFTIEEFLELQKNIKTKLHFRDACGGNAIELEDKNEIENIRQHFENKGIKISVSADNKYVYKD
ncbi:hypothetical protein IMK15_01675 [Sneathia sp. DSM 16631]|jgi:hypothetical protein|uniref:RDAC family protein n=1 Tax=Sneathia TaxID=168808 RepID=UPI0018665008|nr:MULTISPECIES: hypothetical protein [Sneathia]MBE2990075.1 hypothetical protein [Sneathia sp. DSM 16630]MBE3030696.1 hypothetical protein [Sneathia sp. DSM 16631]MDK9581407.1 hypothetical protein [Sneathia vaginalis]